MGVSCACRGEGASGRPPGDPPPLSRKPRPAVPLLALPSPAQSHYWSSQLTWGGAPPRESEAPPCWRAAAAPGGSSHLPEQAQAAPITRVLLRPEPCPLHPARPCSQLHAAPCLRLFQNHQRPRAALRPSPVPSLPPSLLTPCASGSSDPRAPPPTADVNLPGTGPGRHLKNRHNEEGSPPAHSFVHSFICLFIVFDLPDAVLGAGTQGENAAPVLMGIFPCSHPASKKENVTPTCSLFQNRSLEVCVLVLPPLPAAEDHH